MKETTIAGLAREGGVGIETIRYYQRRGLLETPLRSGSAGHGGSVRHYGERDLRQLRFIRTAQSAGFTLEQIAELLALDSTEDRARAHELARQRVVELDAKIAALKAARDALQHLARKCGSGTSGPCPILTAFEQDH